jgi:glycosyltransferase involved in cell wall biosynthesis
MQQIPAVSVVVPVFNEEQSVAQLIRAVRRGMGEDGDWELLLVDDGSTDATVAAAERAACGDVRIRFLLLARNYGQTAAMQAGFDHARGRVIVSMDGDLQNDPADIPRLLARLEEGYDLVVGYRERRQDHLLTRRFPSWVANRLIRWITGVPVRDNGCSLKAYRRELLDRLHLYSDMHRFIPAVAAAVAGARIVEVGVRHHARRFGRSKYGLTRVFKVLADLLTILMIRSFRERPLALFGLGAAAAAVPALLCGAVAVLVQPGYSGTKPQAVVLGGVALLWVGLACYLLMLGLIGEVVLREKRNGGAELPPIVRGVSA